MEDSIPSAYLYAFWLMREIIEVGDTDKWALWRNVASVAMCYQTWSLDWTHEVDSLLALTLLVPKTLEHSLRHVSISQAEMSVSLKQPFQTLLCWQSYLLEWIPPSGGGNSSRRNSSSSTLTRHRHGTLVDLRFFIYLLYYFLFYFLLLSMFCSFV